MLMPNLETDLTGDVLKASPSLVAVERVVMRHYRGYPFNRTWGILIRSAEHETANAPSGIAGWRTKPSRCCLLTEVILSQGVDDADTNGKDY